MHYLIEFRFHGYAKSYSKRLIYDVGRKFRVRGVTGKKVVPHISLFGPFTTRYEKKMIAEVINVARNYNLVSFKVKGFDYFDNVSKKVIYLDIEPSVELKQLRFDLSNRLRNITNTKSVQDGKDKNQFYFHATIAFKDIDYKFDQIWRYIKKKEEPNIQQHLLRITILKGSKIFYEYDLLQKRLLNRRQALNKSIFNQTILLLKQQQRFQVSKKEISLEEKQITLS